MTRSRREFRQWLEDNPLPTRDQAADAADRIYAGAGEALEYEITALVDVIKKLDCDLGWIRHELRTTISADRDARWRDGAIALLETNSELGSEAWNRNRKRRESAQAALTKAQVKP